MLTFTTAEANDYLIIQGIAKQTWPKTFGEILSPEQIEYMLTMMYSLAALHEQVQNKHHVFILAKWDEEAVGFASYELNHQSSFQTKIHKLYLLPASQGKHIGKLLINEIAARAKANGDRALVLNVNRYNSAIQFYEKVGFNKKGEETIDIGEGYWMEDFIFEKQLSDSH